MMSFSEVRGEARSSHHVEVRSTGSAMVLVCRDCGWEKNLGRSADPEQMRRESQRHVFRERHAGR